MATSAILLLATLLAIHLVPSDCGKLKDHLTDPQVIGWGMVHSTGIGRRDGALMIIVQLIVGLVVLAILGKLIHWIWKNYGKGRFEGTHECPLCLERVEDRLWTSGEHRRLCSGTLWEKLKTFPQHHNKKCPLCHESLRLWPQQGEPFACYNKECVHRHGDGPVDENQRWYGRKNKRLVENTGGNRYSCYVCNVSYCLECINRVEVDNEEPVKPQRSLIKKTSSPSKNKAGSAEEKVLLPPPSYEESMNNK